MSVFNDNVTLPIDHSSMASMTMNAPNEKNQAEPRYSKRKRVQVTYAYSDDEDDILDEEEDFEPQMKKAKRVVKNLPKHKIFPFMLVAIDRNERNRS
jgi:hypothetical protein